MKTNPLIFFREIIAVLVLSFMENKFIVLKIQPFFFNLKAALNCGNQCPLHVQINEVDVRVSGNCSVSVLKEKCYIKTQKFGWLRNY